MKLTELIAKKSIIPSLKATDKRGIIHELVAAMRKSCDGEKFAVSDVVTGIMDREKVGSTGLGGGVAIPHAKLDSVKGVIGAFGRCTKGIDFSAVDGEPVQLVFLILAPPAKNEVYLKALQTTMTAIKRPNFSKFLKAAKSAKDIEEIFKDVEEVAAV